MDPKIDQKTSPKSIKNRSKIDIKRKPEENTRKSKNEQPSIVFACFLMSAGVNFLSKIDPKSVEKLIKKRCTKQSIWGAILDRFWSHLGGSKTVQNRSKTGSETRAILRRRRTLVRRPLTGGPGRWGPRWPRRARTVERINRRLGQRKMAKGPMGKSRK